VLLGRWSRQLRRSCAGANMVYSQAEFVFILENYFTLKLFAAVHKSCGKAYPDKKVPHKKQYTDWSQTFRIQEVSV
jgi:hypothetical protein